MKIILALFCVFCFIGSSALSAQELKGQVKESWTIEKARKEAFKNLPENIDFSKYASINPFHCEVVEAIKNDVNKIGNLEVELFDDGTYAVREIGALEGLYYDQSGNLKALHFDDGPDYPKTTYKYLYPEGVLIGVSISPQKGNNYVFLYNGEFILHWIGNKAYNKDGNLIETRKTIQEEEF